MTHQHRRQLTGTETAVYYKALRPDGTDFATGTTRPVLGQWMPPITGELALCRRGYHVSDAVAETLIGGSWPCLLARVEIPEGDWEHREHKLVVSTYRITEWLPAHQALGPNGQEVAALIERARLLTAPELQRLDEAATWYATWYAAGDATWGAARDAARRAAWDAAWYAAMDTARDAAWGATRRAARYAALALIVRDLIPPAEFDVLYGTWAQAIGE